MVWTDVQGHLEKEQHQNIKTNAWSVFLACFWCTRNDLHFAFKLTKYHIWPTVYYLFCGSIVSCMCEAD